jgi:hypothetical protein
MQHKRKHEPRLSVQKRLHHNTLDAAMKLLLKSAVSCVLSLRMIVAVIGLGADHCKLFGIPKLVAVFTSGRQAADK